MGQYFRLGIAMAALVISLAVCGLSQPDDTRRGGSAHALAAGDPVAVIAWIPSEVSNCTWLSLDGSHSTDPDGYITNYTWRIEVNNGTTTLWGQTERPYFKTLGLYKITLTVTDNNGSSGMAFAAVYSMIDQDRDDLPDWWEMRYFLYMEEIGSDDYDNDGYTNLEEYASGQDPTTQNARPGFVQDLKDNWPYVALAAAVTVVVVLAMRPRLRRRRKEDEQKKIDFALEIEKALQGEK